MLPAILAYLLNFRNLVKQSYAGLSLFSFLYIFIYIFQLR